MAKQYEKKNVCFFSKLVKYLGNIIDKNRLHMNPDTVRAIENAPVPDNVDRWCSFIGLVNFY